MPEILVKLIANIAFPFGKWWIVHSPDWYVALHLRLARRLAYAFTGDEFLRNVITELVDIFEQGGRPAEIARMVFRESDRAYPAAVVKGALRKE